MGPTLIADSCMTPTIVCTKLVIVLAAALEQTSCAEYVPTWLSAPVDTEPLAPAKVIGVVKVPSLAESTQLAAW